MVKFSKTFLNEIKKNTNINAHGYNYYLIAKKIKSKLEPKIKLLNQKHKKLGYLNSAMSKRQYQLYQLLMKEIKTKYPKEFKSVYSRL